MASVALDGTRLGTTDGLTRPGTWLVSPRYDLGFQYLEIVLYLNRYGAAKGLIGTPRLARP